MGTNAAVIFGMTVAQFEDLSLKVGFTGLLCLLAFMLAQLARESKAGKYGTAWIYIGLGGGVIGFIGTNLLKGAIGA